VGARKEGGGGGEKGGGRGGEEGGRQRPLDSKAFPYSARIRGCASSKGRRVNPAENHSSGRWGGDALVGALLVGEGGAGSC